MRLFLLTAAASLTLASVAPASAQAPTERSGTASAAAAAKKANDPQKRICKRSNDISSRLPRGKVCMTRQQQEERRLLDRESIERGQASRSLNAG